MTMQAGGAHAIEAGFIEAAEAVREIDRGHFVVVADGEHPDSDADVMIAAEYASADAINFLAAEARGVIYLGLTDERCRELQLGPMTDSAEAGDWRSAFTVMIDAREGISTGISAEDRARTVAAAIDPRSDADDLVRPGHIVPLRAQPGGTLTRAGRTESFVDLPRMAGRIPAGVASTVMRDDGFVATVADLGPWCRRHDVKMVSVAAVAAEAVRRLPWLDRREDRRLATEHGGVDTAVFTERYSGEEHVALLGAERPARPRVAVYGLCVAGHALGDLDCVERPRLDDGVRAVAEGELDVLVHVGVRGLCCRDDAALAGGDERPLSRRAWPVVAKILSELGAETVEPWHGPPRDWAELEQYGLNVNLNDPGR